MQLRSLGNSEVKVSAIGLGCAGMSEGYGTPDERQSLQTLSTALSNEINFLDTADVYGGGHNEELLGRFIQNQRTKVVLATKFGLVRKPGAPPIDNSAQYARAACEDSLRRLKTDWIDLYYLQRRNPEVPIEHVVGAMADLVQAGKVRYLGLSEVLPETLRRAHAVHPIAAVQSEYSLWTRGPETEMLGVCRELGVTFVAYCPLGRGFLADAITSIDALEANDFRRRLPRFQDGTLLENRRLLPALRSLAAEREVSAAQIALAWLLCKHPHVVPIPGSKQPHHVAQNAAAARLQLTDQEIAKLDTAFSPSAVVGDRYPPPAMAGIESA